MKNIKFLSFLTLAGILVFTSCNKEEKEIKKTAEGFLNAINMLNISEARKYATEETGKTLDIMEQGLALQSPEILAESRKEAANKSYEVTKVEIKNDEAIASCKMTDKTNPDTKSPMESLRLKKVDGKWLVNQPKESDIDNSSDDETLPTEENVEVEEVVTEQPAK